MKNCTAGHKADNLLAMDSEGKILVSIRNWDPEEDGLLDYNDLEESELRRSRAIPRIFSRYLMSV